MRDTIFDDLLLTVAITDGWYASRIGGARAMWKTVKSWMSRDTPKPVLSDQRKRTRLVLFIHGIGGSHASTFGRFADLLREDPAIAALYDTDAFDYSSGFTAIGGAPTISDVARYLATTIDNKYPNYSEIVVLAHSMGGLITRRYIADTLLAGRQLKISRVVYFATPHLGALAAKIGAIATSTLSAVVAAVPGGGSLGKAVSALITKGPSEQVGALDTTPASFRI